MIVDLAVQSEQVEGVEDDVPAGSLKTWVLFFASRADKSVEAGAVGLETVVRTSVPFLVLGGFSGGLIAAAFKKSFLLHTCIFRKIVKLVFRRKEAIVNRIVVSLLCAAALVSTASAQQPLTAKATFINAEGNEIGNATLTQTPTGVLISLNLIGLSTGAHAFHIHEKGVCN
ncbi:MAG: hypothetical protein WB820_04980, partial [Rhodoplanes sp.]